MVRANAARFACPADHLEVRDMLHGLQPCLVIKRVEVPAVSPASYNNGRAKCQSSQNPVHKRLSRNAKNKVSLSERNWWRVNIYLQLSLTLAPLRRTPSGHYKPTTIRRPTPLFQTLSDDASLKNLFSNVNWIDIVGRPAQKPDSPLKLVSFWQQRSLYHQTRRHRRSCRVPPAPALDWRKRSQTDSWLPGRCPGGRGWTDHDLEKEFQQIPEADHPGIER